MNFWILGWGGLTVLGAVDSLPLGLTEKPEEGEPTAGQGVSEGPRYYDYGPGSDFGTLARLTRDGPNRIVGEKAPSVWAVALGQLRDPMNIMLVAVAIVSLAIGEVSTAILVAVLVVLNVVLGARQELAARASVDALSKMQVPQAKVLRGGVVAQVPAVEVVPGDIVQLEPNIHAGVKYIRMLVDRYYAKEPMDDLNKMLFAFAAYNAGPGRIRQLRREAADRNLDPNVWFNNVERVASERIGRETVTYVSNIYKYYVAYLLIQGEYIQRRELKSKTGTKSIP